MNYGIGVDIGGTKMAIVLGTHKGRILMRRQMETLKHGQSRTCMRALIREIKTMIQESKIKKSRIVGIGIGMPGAVNSQKGTVSRSPHMAGWEKLDIKKNMQRSLKLPVRMANDANAGAIGERIFGQAKKTKTFIYMTVSTGVGGGIYANGSLLTGSNFVAGEIGHMVIEAQGEPWKMNEIGVLEAYASGTGIVHYVSQQIRKGRGSAALKKLRQDGKMKAEHIGLLAKKNDSLAVEAYKRAAHYLGIGIGNLLNIINPELVILGGGVWRSAPSFFLKDAIRSAKRWSWKEAFQGVRIIRSRLGNDVGTLGALALVFEDINE